jgi:RES domain
MSDSNNQASVSEIRSTINSINRLNLDVADYDYLVRRVGRLIVGIPLYGSSIQPETRLYRARKSLSKPKSIADLGAPPAELIVSYQRCNPPNEPMFYCSTHQATACYEVDAKPGDLIYISCWTVCKKFFFQIIPPDRLRTSDDNRLALLATFFETKFTQPIHQTFSSQYKITAAIADRLTAKEFSLTISNSSSGHKLHEDGVGCIMYPSVAYLKDADCLAIRPKIVESCLALSYVEEWQITSICCGELSVNRIDMSSSFDEGKILWAGKPLYWTLSNPGQVATATLEHDGWVMRNEHGKVLVPG